MARIPTWTYRSYVTPEGVDGVLVWFESLSPRAKAHVGVQLSDNRLKSPEQWGEAGEHKLLKRELIGLEALRFMVTPKKKKFQPDEVEHYRILGYSNRPQMEFTMVKGFKKEYGQRPYEQFGDEALALCALCKTNPTRSQIVRWLDE